MKKKEIKKDGKKSLKRNSSSRNFLYFGLSGLFLIILFIVGFFYTREHPFKDFQSKSKTYRMEEVPCLKQGRICSREDIRKGIKIEYDVNDKKTYEFYLISNSENSATFIMSDDLIVTDWNEEMINFKGPQKALYDLNMAVADWVNVPVLSHYEYTDYSYQNHLNICTRKTVTYEDYDCTKTAGYQKFMVEDGQGKLIFNLPLVETDIEDIEFDEEWDFDGVEIRARMITLEEIGPLGDKDSFARLLIDHSKNGEAYWTLSSAAYPGNDYVVEAHTVVNRYNRVSIENTVVNHGEESATISVRPVITLNKK